MATNNLTNSDEELPLATTGEPTDQLEPEEDDFDDETEPEDDDDVDLKTNNSDFDNEPMDDDEDLDEDEVKRLFTGEDPYSENDNKDGDNEEPYEGIRQGDDEDEGLADDNMSGMPVIPSPS